MRDTGPLFHLEGTHFVPTPAAGNPWGELTGGGPVAGLLARAIEQAIDDPDLFVARLTVDLMRPVPRKPVSVQVQQLRTGKRLQVVQARLFTDEQLLTNATAHLIRRSTVDGPEASGPAPFPTPEGLTTAHLLPPELGLLYGVHDEMEVRWVRDQSATDVSQAWMRMPLPLLPGETLSPLQHVAILSDAISAAAPIGPIFGPWINTDLTVYLHREMRGEWLGMEIRRDTQPSGIGAATARLYDTDGPIGTAHESIMVNQLG